MRKQIIQSPSATTSHSTGGLDVGAIATVLVTSELAGHPVENAFDGQAGPGSSRWISETGGEQTLKLAFDAPQAIRSVSLVIEETTESRTQELQLSVSADGEKPGAKWCARNSIFRQRVPRLSAKNGSSTPRP